MLTRRAAIFGATACPIAASGSVLPLSLTAAPFVGGLTIAVEQSERFRQRLSPRHEDFLADVIACGRQLGPALRQASYENYYPLLAPLTGLCGFAELIAVETDNPILRSLCRCIHAQGLDLARHVNEAVLSARGWQLA